jgi:succinate-semialdehyde dehydrogenase/glutarate-semialdehyde dehydrogenase
MTLTTDAQAPTAAQAFYAEATIGLHIDGEWRGASGTRSRDVIDPTDENVIGRVPVAETADLEAAVAAAVRAFPIWRDMSLDDRTRILMKAAANLRERAAHIGRLMTIEEGKPLAEATAECIRVAKAIEWDAQDARRAYGRIIPVDPDTQLTVHHQPSGPVGAIEPWNFPVGSPNRKLAAAIAAGCSIVIKPSEETPASACALAQCFIDAGLPSGVLNVVFGRSAEVADFLISDPRIRMVAFTGSIPVGKELAQLAGAYMKPTVMELGGHAPVIVAADADPKVAAKRVAMAKYANAGQVCTSPSRVFVHRSLYDAFLAEFIAATKAVVVGNGLDAGVTMGPLSSDRRLAAMEHLVADAVAKGAKVETGGARIGETGYFFEPTILTSVPDDAAIMSDEPFGPITPVLPFDDLEQAIERANELPFGLAAYGFTESASTTDLLVRGFDAGILSINHCGGSTPEAPSGGVKESGWGREGGAEGLDSYLVIKRVSHKLR